jgi:PKD repeat protein
MKKQITLLSAFLVAFIFIAQPAVAEPESTNSTSEVTPVDLNTEYSGLLDVSNEEDWYKFEIPNDGYLIIEDSTASSTLGYLIDLYEQDGETHLKQQRRFEDNSGARLSINLTPGIYLVRFIRYSSSSVNPYGNYKFTLNFTEVSLPGDLESNDSVLLAQDVAINNLVTANLGFRKVGKYDKEDWYKFEIPNDGFLVLEDSTTSTLGYVIDLFEQDGETLIKNQRRFEDNSGTRLSISLTPGMYFVRFTRYSAYTTNPFGEYKFTLIFSEVSLPGDIESNDFDSAAQVVAVNNLVSANLGFRKIGKYDEEDWFKFEIPNDGFLVIDDSTTSTLGYLINLYEEDGETLIKNQRRYEDNSGSRLSVSLTPGNYYVMFNRYSSSTTNPYGEYKFTMNFTEVSLPGDIESNDVDSVAQEVTTDTLISANLGFRKIGMYDKTDWFRFEIQKEGLLTIQDSTTSTLGYMIYLYEEDGETLIKQQRRFEDNSGNRMSKKLTPGIYFLQFSRYSSSTTNPYGEYKFMLDFLPVPEADFSFIQNINSVVFTNNTLYGESFVWDFTDGNTSNEVNPGHEFAGPGEYNVELIATNPAGKDTVSKYITIYGLQKIIDNVGGNTGDVSIDIYGGGFTDESTVKLTYEGFDDIIPDTILYLRKGILSALFNLRGAVTGEWDVEIETPGRNTIIEDGGFTIVEGTKPEPWVEINGRNRALLGRWSTYTVNYGNSGNVDAAGVPLWLAMSENQDIEVDFVDFEIVPPPYAVETLQLDGILRDSIPLFFSTDTLFGEPFESRIYPLIIPNIPAGQTGKLTIKVKSMQNFQLMAWVNPPMFESPMSQQIKDCIFWAQMKAIADGVVGIVAGALPLGCINGIVTNYIYNPWSYEKPTDDEPKSIGSHLWTLTSTLIGCAGDLPPFKAYKLTVAILQFGAAVIDNSIADKECREAFSNQSVTNMNVRTVTSFDPNEKAGPEGFTDNNYIRKSSYIDYTIYFENKDTAQAPAQEITIIDSIDKNVFDISKFNFKSVTIADSTIDILPGLTTFAEDINMQPAMDITVRATGNIDTTTGVVTWHFRALDPVTLAENENPGQGVLLPNIISPQGEGNVAFNVGIKPETGNSDVLKNKAKITFDFNAPIITNEFTNIIDAEQPLSNIMPLTQELNDVIHLEIQGSDNESGIDFYTVYVSVNDSDFVPLIKTLNTEFTYQPKSGGNYKFYSIATDKVGNEEPVPVGFDSETNLIVSENKIIKDGEIEVWPNPMEDHLYIQVRNMRENELIVELKTVLGQSIIRKNISSFRENNIRFDVSQITPGIYILSIQSENSDQIYRMIKN